MAMKSWSFGILLSVAVFNAAAQSSFPVASWEGMPLCFEPCGSSKAGPVEFLARGPNFRLRIGPAETRIFLRRAEAEPSASPLDRWRFALPRAAHTRTLTTRFLDANPRAAIEGENLGSGKVNYLAGRDPSAWRQGVETYRGLRVEQLYPGVDLRYYGNQRQIEYDLRVAPGADPSRIALSFEGADLLRINERGELVLEVEGQELRQPVPSIYQMTHGAPRRVQGGFRLRDSRTVEFALGSYDRSQPLVIDPVLSYSTYFSGNEGDTALAVKVDSAGSIYVAGITLAEQYTFTPTNVVQTTNAGGKYDGDAFVAKLDSTGTNLIFFTYLGGTNDDGAFDMALDSSNNIYLTGFTDSPDFPVVPAAGIPGLPQGAHIGGPPNQVIQKYAVDAFVTEIDATGSNLVFSTYLGGADADIGGGIAVDSSNDVYVTGFTLSTNFPTTNALVLASPLPGTTNKVLNVLVGTNMAFVTKLGPGGSGLVYSTFLGGTNVTEGEGIAADAAGFAYVAGYTASTNFPLTPNAFDKDFNHATNAHSKYSGVTHPPVDAFVAQIAPLGSNLVYSTYLGGTNHDAATRIVVDINSNVYVTGYSESPDFPNTVSTNVTKPGVTNLSFVNADAFVTKFDFSGTNPVVVFSALFGGPGEDTGWGVAADNAGNSFVIGSTDSHTNFPIVNTNGYLTFTNQGSNDVFVTAFNTNGTALLYSVILGGNNDDLGYGIALDAQDNAYLVGQTRSTNFPTVSPFAPPAQWTNAFIAKVLFTIPTNTVTVLTEPTNLTVELDGVDVTTPYTTNWLFGSIHALGAPSTNTGPGDVQYVWQSWSDGGFQSHQVMINGDATYTATYGVPGASVPAAGNYAGLFYDTNNPSLSNSGAFHLTVDAHGGLSASLQLVGETHSFSGSFSSAGYYSNSIIRSAPKPPLLVALQGSGSNAVTGQVNNGLSTAQLLAYRNVFSSANPAPQAGQKFTLLIGGGPDSLVQPQGESSAAISVSANGAVHFSGTLADGSKVSESATLSDTGLFPLFIPLYSGHGAIFGWLSFSNMTSALGGTTVWIRQPRQGLTFYPAGFTLVSQALGSTYSGHPVLSFSSGLLTLEGGNLVTNLDTPVTLSTTKIVGASKLLVNLTLLPSTGLLHGTIANPGRPGKPFTVNGALLQNQNFAGGSFLGTNQSGLLLVQP